MSRDVQALTRRGSPSENKVLNLSLIFRGSVPRDRCTKESLWGETRLCLAAHCPFYPWMVSVSGQQQLIQGVSDSSNYRATHRHRWAFSFLVYCFNHVQIKTLKSPHLSFVEKQIDADQEVIRLCSTEPTEVRDLPKRIPKDSARYHFFLYKHSHEGDYLQSTGDWMMNRRIFQYNLFMLL